MANFSFIKVKSLSQQNFDEYFNVISYKKNKQIKEHLVAVIFHGLDIFFSSLWTSLIK